MPEMPLSMAALISPVRILTSRLASSMRTRWRIAKPTVTGSSTVSTSASFRFTVISSTREPISVTPQISRFSGP